MSWKKFLTSPVFFKNLALALLIASLFVIGVMKFLSIATNHGEEIPVPKLAKMSLEKAEERLNEVDLEIQLLDTVDYNPQFPPYSIVEQDPLAGVTVKDGRKVYVKINSAGYAKVNMPDLIQKSYRQALSTLRALGLKEGKVKYVEYMAKDVVLEVSVNGKKIKAGDRILKSSTVDFVLGDGKTGFNDQELDSINKQEILEPAQEEDVE